MRYAIILSLIVLLNSTLYSQDVIPQWGTYFGGEVSSTDPALPNKDSEGFNFMKIHNGRIFTVGSTNASDYPLTPGAFKDTKSQDFLYTTTLNVFDLDGKLIWNTMFQELFSPIQITDLEIDSLDNIVIAGRFSDEDYEFVTTPGVISESFNGRRFWGDICSYCGDGFLAKFSSDGKLIWSTFLGGSNNEIIQSIAIAPDNSIIAVGISNSSDLPMVGNSYQKTRPNNQFAPSASCGFIYKINQDASSILWSTYFGGEETTQISDVATINDKIQLVGSTMNKDFGSPGKLLGRLNNNEQVGAFLTEFSLEGDFRWTTFLGFTMHIYEPNKTFNDMSAPQTIDYDNTGNIIISGETLSPHFDNIKDIFSENPTINPTSLSSVNLFVMKVDNSGENLISSSVFGGSNYERIISSSYDPSTNNIIFTGITSSVDFPQTRLRFDNEIRTDENTDLDIFYIILDKESNALTSSVITSSGTDISGGAELLDKDILIAGKTENPSFPVITQNTFQSNFKGESDAFLARLTPELGYCDFEIDFVLFDTVVAPGEEFCLFAELNPTCTNGSIIPDRGKLTIGQSNNSLLLLNSNIEYESEVIGDSTYYHFNLLLSDILNDNKVLELCFLPLLSEYSSANISLIKNDPWITINQSRQSVVSIEFCESDYRSIRKAIRADFNYSIDGNELEIFLTADTEGNYRLALFDISNKLLLEQSFSTNQPSYSNDSLGTIDISGIANGSYILVLRSPQGEIVTKSIIIQR